MNAAVIIAILAGAGIGAALGRAGRCSTGACSLISNWKRGAFFGGLMGLVFGLTIARNSSTRQAQHTPNILPITEAQFAAEVMEADRPVVVDFYAPWCGPCKVLSPRLNKLAAARTNRIKFVKVNVDEAQSLAREYDVRAIPTLMFFREGKVVDSAIGLLPEKELELKLDALLASSYSDSATRSPTSRVP